MDYMREIDRMVLTVLAHDTDMPEEMREFLECFINHGCSLKSVLSALIEFGEKAEKMEVQADLKELLKDFNWEDAGNE